MFTSPSLVEIAKEQNCSVEQVILSWNLQRNVAFIPKSVRSERMLDNFGALKSSLEINVRAIPLSLDDGSSGLNVIM